MGKRITFRCSECHDFVTDFEKSGGFERSRFGPDVKYFFDLFLKGVERIC